MQKNEGGPLLYTTKKHEFGMDKILIRSGNLKFLKESIRGKNSLTLVLTIICLDMTPKTQATKAKISEWNDITLKSFWLARETVNEMKEGTYGTGETVCQ